MAADRLAGRRAARGGSSTIFIDISHRAVVHDTATSCCTTRKWETTQKKKRRRDMAVRKWERPRSQYNLVNCWLRNETWWRTTPVIVIIVVKVLTTILVSSPIVQWTSSMIDSNHTFVSAFNTAPPFNDMNRRRHKYTTFITEKEKYKAGLRNSDDDENGENEIEWINSTDNRRRSMYSQPLSSSSISKEPSSSSSSSVPQVIVVNGKNGTSTIDTTIVNNSNTKQQQDVKLNRRNSSSETSSSSSTPSEQQVQVEQKKKMNLLWCQSDRCVDVIREEVVGEHNQIILNSPATGQVAYRWSEKPALPYRTTATTTQSTLPVVGGTSNDDDTHQKRTASVLVLVKRGDKDLMRIAAETVSELTQQRDNDDDDGDNGCNIRVLLAPDLAAKLKHYHGVDNDRIGLFDSSPSAFHDHDMDNSVTGGGSLGRGDTDDPNREFNWRVRHVDDDEEEWVQDMMLYKQERSTQFPDLIVCLGGDGLLLHASMMFQGPFPPLLAISGGSLGFLTPFHEDEVVDAVRIALGMSTVEDNYLENEQRNDLQVFPPNMDYDYGPLIKPPHLFGSTLPRFGFGMGDFICVSIRMRLDCRIVNQEGIVRARYNVLNEVVIDRGSSPYLAALECFCDDAHLTTVQADGIIFATPTGSTAYSMAAGGSVVHPGVPSILVTPICPHVLSFRSMVFPDSVVLTCHVPEDARAAASVAFDGKHRRELQRGDSVQIKMSSYPIPTINRQSDTSDWLESLKRSFNFNTRARQQPL